MRIQHNIAALNTQRRKKISGEKSTKSIGHLSSGRKINNSADDAAGLAISEKMRAQIRGMNQSTRNVQDAVSLIQTADGALQSISDIVQRMRELAAQAASDTNQIQVDREALNLEYQQLKKEIDNISASTSFNGIRPLIGQNMGYPQNTAWVDEGLSQSEVSVYIPTYNGPNPASIVPAQADVSGVQTSLNNVVAVGTSSSVNVSGSVGTVSSRTDLTNVIVTDVPAAAQYPVPVMGNNITLSGGEVFQINAADITGVTGITIPAGAKLIIHGNVGNNINISGGGEVRIDGSVAGLTVGSGSSVQITGNATGTVTNNGRLTIGGNCTGNVTNNDYMTIDGGAGVVTNNSGNIMIRGSVGSITNAAGASAELKNAAGATINNSGNMEIAASSNLTNIQNASSGSILIISGSGLRVLGNDGHIDSRVQSTIVSSNTGDLRITGANAEIITNDGTVLLSGTGAVIRDNDSTVIVTGTNATITDNNGDMFVTGANATITDNNGNMRVTGTGATVVDNNGDMEVSGQNATITDNNSNMLVSSTGATVVDNNGDMEVSGQNATITDNSSNMLVSGTGATVVDNNGDMEVRGQNATITDNNSNMLVSGTGATVVDNNGDMEVSGQNATINNNNGDMIVSGQNASVDNNRSNMIITGADARVVSNNGNLYSNVTLEIVTNFAKAFLQANDVVIGSNRGDMLVEGNNALISSNYSRLGITGMVARVTNNSSVGDLRINGDNARVSVNSGVAFIDGNSTNVDNNYGDMRIEGDNARVGVNSGAAFIDGNSTNVDNNYGNMRIEGDYAVVRNLAAGRIRINGDGADATNSGTIHIVGTGTRLNNSSNAIAKLEGDNAAILSNGTGGRVDVDGDNSAININYGSMEINGNNSRIMNNIGNIRLRTDNNARVDNNYGRIEVSSASVITRLVDNRGTILVENNGKISDALGVNNGRIEVSRLAEILIRTNYETVISKGASTIDTNTGYLEVGEWIDDETTPAIGSAGSAHVAENLGGIIRNFSEDLTVVKNISGHSQEVKAYGCICMDTKSTQIIGGGIIENYGTMNVDCDNEAGADMSGLLGEIRHHARQIDVSGVVADEASTIRYVLNGSPQSQLGDWQNLPGDNIGRQLVFDMPPFDNGVTVLDASNKYEAPGTEYDIQKRLDVTASAGTSGTMLLYEIFTPFFIQSGANQGEVTELSFKPVSTNLLATLEDSCDNCVCTLYTTNVGIRESATCALENCDQALQDISLYRAELGAMQNRFEYKINNLGISSENLSASESRIRDLDVAKEMTALAKNQIIDQSSTAMLAQANTLSQSVLQLLQ